MSIIDTYDAASEEILKPEHMMKAIGDFPQTVIAVFQQRIINILIEKYAPTIITHFNPGDKRPVYEIPYKGRRIAVYRTLIGGAGAAGLLEESIALGGRKFVYFGACGTIDKEIPAGHFILPTAAYRDEGTSYHYCPAGDYIKIQTADRLAHIFDGLGIPYITGRTWTTDGFYRETRNNMMKRKAEGCIAVEMECASIMAAAQYRKVAVYQFLYGEDTLDGDDWSARTMGTVTDDAYENYLDLALEIAAKV